LARPRSRAPRDEIARAFIRIGTGGAHEIENELDDARAELARANPQGRLVAPAEVARTVAIFSDPDCPYCRRLEAEMKSLTDITIYTFLMPIASLHPDARSKAITVWCSKDRVAAWHALMWRDEKISAKECPHPVDRNVALGDRLGISGTPTLVAADGRVLPGAASNAQIEAWLARDTTSAVVPSSSKDAAR